LHSLLMYFIPPPPKPPLPPGEWPIPTFRIRVDDVGHPGAQLFFEHLKPYEALKEAVLTVFKWLFTLETVPKNVETVLLVLRVMPGVAHTTGAEVYKEIHFNLDHIVNSSSRAKDEIMGVLVHEMVHCYQYNGQGKAPGGLTEGVADWVRLRGGYTPPHWTERGGDKWDAGYETTGYFLEWIEGKYGFGIVKAMNLTLKDKVYDEEIFKEHTTKKVKKLWALYNEYLEEKKKGKGKEREKPPSPVPTHAAHA